MRKTKILIFQNWGTFLGTTMVACGFENYVDIKNRLKKVKYLDWHKAMEDKPEEFDSHHFSKWTAKDGKTYHLLFLKDWKPDLEHYKILAHELVHAIQFCMPDFLDTDKEHEACAYQHSYLFEEIAKELNKYHTI